MHKIWRSCLFGLTLIALTPAAWADNFGFTGGVVDYTVAATGTYSFSVSGAQGGGAYLDDGGLGAFLSGDVYLTAGTELGIVVGGQGVNGNFGSQYGGGGGGGSFVYIVGATNPLFAAGGGGGAGYYATNGDDAQITTFGSAGQGDQGGAAGTSGSGGLGGFDPTTGYVTNGAGGGGWLGNGGDGLGDGPSAPYGSGLGGVGAFSFLGGAGDGGDGDAGQQANGGFGGGGGGGYQGGGGGGGYSGGGGGDGYESGGGGGGGSYVDGAVLNAVLQSSSQSGDGFVTITADSIVVSSTPEPASFVLLGTGLLIVGFRRRK